MDLKNVFFDIYHGNKWHYSYKLNSLKKRVGNTLSNRTKCLIEFIVKNRTFFHFIEELHMTNVLPNWPYFAESANKISLLTKLSWYNPKIILKKYITSGELLFYKQSENFKGSLIIDMRGNPSYELLLPQKQSYYFQHVKSRIDNTKQYLKRDRNIPRSFSYDTSSYTNFFEKMENS